MALTNFLAQTSSTMSLTLSSTLPLVHSVTWRLPSCLPLWLLPQKSSNPCTICLTARYLLLKIGPETWVARLHRSAKSSNTGSPYSNSPEQHTVTHRTLNPSFQHRIDAEEALTQSLPLLSRSPLPICSNSRDRPTGVSHRGRSRVGSVNSYQPLLIRTIVDLSFQCDRFSVQHDVRQVEPFPLYLLGYTHLLEGSGSLRRNSAWN